MNERGFISRKYFTGWREWLLSRWTFRLSADLERPQTEPLYSLPSMNSLRCISTPFRLAAGAEDARPATS